jgi:hypothetical protein
MTEKPDLNATLTRLRENAAAFQTSLARHTSEERQGKGFAFDVQLIEERDDLSIVMVEDFGILDAAMSGRGAFGDAPQAWGIDRLTDEQLAACKADWPELGMFADSTVRQMADVVGIRMVRAMAQEAVRRAAHVLATMNAGGSAAPTPLPEKPMERDKLIDTVTGALFRRSPDEIAGTESVAMAICAHAPRINALREVGEIAQAQYRAALVDWIKTHAECVCVTNCAEDPATACSLSGQQHVHPRTHGEFGPCAVHRDAPGDL